jgi:RNA polymerase sigma factor (sigma-70 family)
VRTETDEELMNLYVQGDIRAFDELYLRHKAKVYGYLVKRLPTKQQADEVFQVAFLKLHQSRTQYIDGEAFLPWVFTIARNSLFDHLRKTRSESQKVAAYQEHEENNQNSSEKGSLSDRLEEGLAGLSEAQKHLLNQRYIEGLDFEEIAKRADSSPAAVRQSVSRVTRKLKSLLKGSS